MQHLIKVNPSLLVKEGLRSSHTVGWRAAVRRLVWKRWRLRESPQTFFERVSRLLEKVDYRLAIDDDDKDAIYRLRYDGYLREGAISPSFSRRFHDKFDDADNCWTYGFYVDGRLVGSIRFHIATSGYPEMPAGTAFSDLLLPELEAGRVIIRPHPIRHRLAGIACLPGTPLRHRQVAVHRVRVFQCRHVTGNRAQRAPGILQAGLWSSGGGAGSTLPDARQAHQPDEPRLLQHERARPASLPVLSLDLL